MAKLSSIVRRWGLAWLMMATIFGFSSVHSAEMPHFGFLDLLLKKGGHALGYGLLALTYARGLKGEGIAMDSRWLYTAWLMAVLFSATDEYHQSFVPGRFPAVTDVLIDSLGAAIALTLLSRYYKRSNAPIAGH